MTYEYYPLQNTLPFLDLPPVEENLSAEITALKTVASNSDATIETILARKDATLLFMTMAVSMTSKMRCQSFAHIPEIFLPIFEVFIALGLRNSIMWRHISTWKTPESCNTGTSPSKQRRCCPTSRCRLGWIFR